MRRKRFELLPNVQQRSLYSYVNPNECTHIPTYIHMYVERVCKHKHIISVLWFLALFKKQRQGKAINIQRCCMGWEFRVVVGCCFHEFQLSVRHAHLHTFILSYDNKRCQLTLRMRQRDSQSGWRRKTAEGVSGLREEKDRSMYLSVLKFIAALHSQRNKRQKMGFQQ